MRHRFHLAALLSILIAASLVGPEAGRLTAEGRDGEATVAVVVSVYGDLFRHVGHNSVRLNRHDLLTEGDLIRSGSDSHATIQFNEGAIARIGADTQLRVATLRKSEESRSTWLQLLRGSILSQVIRGSDGSEQYRVSTPTAVAGVRGTTFLVDFDDAAGRSEVLLHSGSVEVAQVTEVASRSSELTLSPGEKAVSTAQSLQREIFAKQEEERFRIVEEFESLKVDQYESFLRDRQQMIDELNRIRNQKRPTPPALQDLR